MYPIFRMFTQTWWIKIWLVSYFQYLVFIILVIVILVFYKNRAILLHLWTSIPFHLYLWDMQPSWIQKEIICTICTCVSASGKTGFNVQKKEIMHLYNSYGKSYSHTYNERCFCKKILIFTHHYKKDVCLLLNVNS